MLYLSPAIFQFPNPSYVYVCNDTKFNLLSISLNVVDFIFNEGINFSHRYFINCIELRIIIIFKLKNVEQAKHTNYYSSDADNPSIISLNTSSIGF